MTVDTPPLLNDLPISSHHDDSLGFASIAKMLAQSIWNQPGPYVLHIDGGWGSGKTSFCRLLKTALEAIAQPQPSAIEANAVQSTPVPKDPVDTHSAETKSAGTHRILWAEFVATQFEQTDAPGQALLLFITDRVLSADPAHSGNGYSLLTDSVGAQDKLDSLSCNFGANGINSDVNQVGSVGRFEQWLALELAGNDQDPKNDNAASESHEESSTSRKLVVLIDDLDRCVPEFAADILRVIQRFVGCQNLYFLISADRNVLKQAYRRRFDRILCDGLTPEKALQKYIRTTYTLPSFTKDNPSWIARLVYGPNGNVQYADFFRSRFVAEWKDDLRPILLKALGNTLTPRAYKRILNKLVLLLAPSSMAFPDKEPEPRSESLKELLKRRSVAVFHAAMTQLWPEVEGELAETSTSAIDDFVVRLMGRPYLEVCEKTSFTTHDWEGISAGLFILPSPPLDVLVALRQLAKALPQWCEVRTGASDKSGYLEGKNDEEIGVVELNQEMKNEERREGLFPTNISKKEPADADGDGVTQSVNPRKDPDADGVIQSEMPVKSLQPNRFEDRPVANREEAELRLKILELEIDGGTAKSDATERRLSQVWELIEKFGDDLNPISIGNLAVSAEQQGFPEIAWKIHSHQRDHGKFEGDFKLARQYVSFLIDFKAETLPSPDPQAQTDVPTAAARYWLSLFSKDSLRVPEEQESYERFNIQLATRSGEALDIDAMAASLMARPTMNGAVFLLRCAGDTQDVRQPVVDAVQHVVGHSALNAYEKLRLNRALGDYLAVDAAGRTEYRQLAKKLYGDLRGTELWNSATKHNLATLTYGDDEDASKAEELWREAYRDAPDDGSIQRALADFFKRSRRPDLALRVLRGEPL